MNAVEQLKAELQDQPKNPLRPHQVREHQEELTRVQAIAGGLDQDGASRPWMPGDRGAAFRRGQQIKKVLAEQAPKPATGERKDRIFALTTEVIDHVVVPSMLTDVEMRRNPAGAVGQFMRREGSKTIKDAIQTARRGLLALEPDNDDPDFLNMDRFRPSGTPQNGSTFMANAQIPGYVGFSHIPPERWPMPEPQNTALGQVKAAERARKPQSAASLAGLAKGRARIKQNREARQAAEAAEAQDQTPA